MVSVFYKQVSTFMTPGGMLLGGSCTFVIKVVVVGVVMVLMSSGEGCDWRLPSAHRSMCDRLSIRSILFAFGFLKYQFGHVII